MTVTGKTLGENIEGAEVYNDDVIRPLDNPIYNEGALAVLKGNLAPDGCVIKPARLRAEIPEAHRAGAGVRRLSVDEGGDRRRRSRRHRGHRAGPAQCRAAGRARACRNGACCRSRSKLVKQGVRDMLRLSDARMSGTSYGACILHVAPEAYIGGPLALVQTGDIISLDVDKRTHRHGRVRRGAGHAAAPPGSSPSRASSAAMAGCSPGTSGRPTRAATSTSSRPSFGAPVAEPSIY